VSPQKPTCRRGSGFSRFEIITKTRPVIGWACVEAGKETLNLKSETGVFVHARAGVTKAPRTASARTTAQKRPG